LDRTPTRQKERQHDKAGYYRVKTTETFQAEKQNATENGQGQALLSAIILERKRRIMQAYNDKHTEDTLLSCLCLS